MYNFCFTDKCARKSLSWMIFQLFRTLCRPAVTSVRKNNSTMASYKLIGENPTCTVHSNNNTKLVFLADWDCGSVQWLIINLYTCLQITFHRKTDIGANLTDGGGTEVTRSLVMTNQMQDQTKSKG